MKDFDQALRTAAPGTIDGAKLLNRFAYEQLAVPSGGPVGEHFEGFIPALVQRDGEHHLVAFSSVQRFKDEGRLGVRRSRCRCARCCCGCPRTWAS